MKKYILLLFMITGFLQAQTLQNTTFGNTTTNTLKIKTLATVTSVNFLPTMEADFSLAKIDPVLLPLSTATINAINVQDATVLHKTGNETKNGTLTATSFIKTSGISSQFLKADGSSDDTTYANNDLVAHLAGTELFTGAKGFSAVTTFNNGINDIKLIRGAGVNGRLIFYRPGDTVGAESVSIGGGAAELLIRGGVGAIGHSGVVLNIANTVTGDTMLSADLGNVVLNAGSVAGLSVKNTTRNVIIQNGGTFTDAGYRLDVFGTTRLQSAPIFTNAPTTSAGAYYILTGNNLTNQTEKVLSTTFASSASPALTGTPTAPTATEGTKTTQLATTLFANDVVNKSYTVATLPTPTGTAFAIVTDALAPTYMATIVGGGAVVTPVFYNGTNWVAH